MGSVDDGGDHTHAHGPAEAIGSRVPAHVTADLSLGVDVLRARAGRPGMTLRLDVQNVTDNVFVIARGGQFSATQYSTPRLISATVRLSF